MPDLNRVNQALSSIYHYLEFLTEGPADVFTALEQEIPHIDPKSWTERMNWGGIYFNGLPVTENHELKFPCKIEYYEPKIPIAAQRDYYPAFDPKWIIYQDEYIAAVYKPADLTCHKSKEQWQISLYRYLCDHYDVPIHMPSRLDYSTAGLVLISHNPVSHADTQRIFSHHQVTKEYLLFIDTHFNWKEIRINDQICRDPRHQVLRRTSPTTGKPAETVFTVLKETPQGSLIKAQPKTGRTHQIRVHCRYSLDHGIVGDKFYDGIEHEQLCLLSHSLKFMHPINQQEMEIGLPGEFLPDWCQLDFQNSSGSSISSLNSIT